MHTHRTLQTRRCQHISHCICLSVHMLNSNFPIFLKPGHASNNQIKITPMMSNPRWKPLNHIQQVCFNHQSSIPFFPCKLEAFKNHLQLSQQRRTTTNPVLKTCNLITLAILYHTTTLSLLIQTLRGPIYIKLPKPSLRRNPSNQNSFSIPCVIASFGAPHTRSPSKHPPS